MQETGRSLLNTLRILGHTDDRSGIVHPEDDEPAGAVGEGAERSPDRAQVPGPRFEPGATVFPGADPIAQTGRVHQRFAGSRER